jgi:hypothetical protein
MLLLLLTGLGLPWSIPLEIDLSRNDGGGFPDLPIYAVSVAPAVFNVILHWFLLYRPIADRWRRRLWGRRLVALSLIAAFAVPAWPVAAWYLRPKEQVAADTEALRQAVTSLTLPGGFVRDTGSGVTCDVQAALCLTAEHRPREAMDAFSKLLEANGLSHDRERCHLETDVDDLCRMRIRKGYGVLRVIMYPSEPYTGSGPTGIEIYTPSRYGGG